MTNLNKSNVEKAILLSTGIQDKDKIEKIISIQDLNFIDAFSKAYKMNIPDEYLDICIERKDTNHINLLIKSFQNNLNEEQMKNIQTMIENNESYFYSSQYIRLIKELQTFKSDKYTNNEIEKIFLDMEDAKNREYFIDFIKNNLNIDLFEKFINLEDEDLQYSILELSNLKVSEKVFEKVLAMKGVGGLISHIEFINKNSKLSNDLKEKLFINTVEYYQQYLMQPFIMLFYQSIYSNKNLSIEYKDNVVKRLLIDQEFNDTKKLSMFLMMFSRIKKELDEELINVLIDEYISDPDVDNAIIRSINMGMGDIETIKFISKLNQSQSISYDIALRDGIKNKEDIDLILSVADVFEVNIHEIIYMIKTNVSRSEIEKYIKVRKLNTKEECIEYFKNEYDEEFLNSIFE